MSTHTSSHGCTAFPLLPDSATSRPLTKTVHDALMILGKSAAFTPAFDGGVGARMIRGINAHVYKNAAQCMLLGFDFDFGALFMLEGGKCLKALENTVQSLPRSSNISEAMARAMSVYHDVIGTKYFPLDASHYYHQYLENESKDRLGGNVQNLEWCNVTWDRILETGIPKVEAVIIFVSIIMTGMAVCCPVQDFPSQWSVVGNTRTLDELKVIGLSARIREKPEWRRKLREESIVSKWREEAYAQDVTSSMFEFMVAELHWFAGQVDIQTGIDHSTVPGVFLSDSLISFEDRDALRASVNVLSAQKRKDWHPRSNDQVLDLVHPSMFPYIRGRTRRFFQPENFQASYIETNLEMTSKNIDIVASSILRFLNPSPPERLIRSPVAALTFAGNGVPTYRGMPGTDIVECKWSNGSNYQWLPVDVEVSSSAPHAVHFLSYINNLHPASPSEAPLYPILERIFACFVPLFERTLTETRRRRTGDAGARTEFLNGPTRNHNNYWDIPEPSSDDCGSDEEEVLDDLMEGYENNRKFVRPVVAPFVAPDSAGPAQVNFGGRILQVIVKMANVHLTADKPEYSGGSWHVEGTDNERIVATGIYYYESENISEPSLEFRQAVEEPKHEQWKYDHLYHLYGMSHFSAGGPLTNQHLGVLSTPEGRCICFPNGMQHRLAPFKLLDPAKPGHRKFVVFFLIDPSQRILSTSDVPPQQLEWLFHELRMQIGTRLSVLPPELFNLVCEHVRDLALEGSDSDAATSSKWFMSLGEAHMHRLRLMDERATFVDQVNTELYERSFNLCEH